MTVDVLGYMPAVGFDCREKEEFLKDLKEACREAAPYLFRELGACLFSVISVVVLETREVGVNLRISFTKWTDLLDSGKKKGIVELLIAGLSRLLAEKKIQGYIGRE